MGTADEAAEAAGGRWDERPLHEVALAGFEMLRTEVTVEQYTACVRSGACPEPDHGRSCSWGVAGRAEHPINCVNLGDARAFCAWAGGRLASESEWEFAARGGGQGSLFPWGDEPATCELAVMAGDGAQCSPDGTQPVCSRPAGSGPLDLCDMAGNVWEWVADCYYYRVEGGYVHSGYHKAPADGGPQPLIPGRQGTEFCDELQWVVRGGGFGSEADVLRARNRHWETSEARFDSIGIRCVREPTE